MRHHCGRNVRNAAGRLRHIVQRVLDATGGGRGARVLRVELDLLAHNVLGGVLAARVGDDVQMQRNGGVLEQALHEELEFRAEQVVLFRVDDEEIVLGVRGGAVVVVIRSVVDGLKFDDGVVFGGRCSLLPIVMMMLLLMMRLLLKMLRNWSVLGQEVAMMVLLQLLVLVLVVVLLMLLVLGSSRRDRVMMIGLRLLLLLLHIIVVRLEHAVPATARKDVIVGVEDEQESAGHDQEQQDFVHGHGQQKEPQIA